MEAIHTSSPLWVRSKDGMIFGVCKGLAKHFEIEVGLMRVIWVIGIFFGLPLLLYFVLALSLPREDKIENTFKPKLLGVCFKLANKLQIEVGLLRALALGSALISCGLTLFFYIVAHIILISEKNAP